MTTISKTKKKKNIKKRKRTCNFFFFKKYTLKAEIHKIIYLTRIAYSNSYLFQFMFVDHQYFFIYAITIIYINLAQRNKLNILWSFFSCHGNKSKFSVYFQIFFTNLRISVYIRVFEDCLFFHEKIFNFLKLVIWLIVVTFQESKKF